VRSYSFIYLFPNFYVPIDLPLIVSVQAPAGSPLDDPESLYRSAAASVAQGVEAIRLEGVLNIKAIANRLPVTVIGLIKRSYPGSDVYITATSKEVTELVEAPCHVIALDCTSRARPNGEEAKELIDQIHKGGKAAMADCDSVETALTAYRMGADMVSTTLAGYTGGPVPEGPDIRLVAEISKAFHEQSEEIRLKYNFRPSGGQPEKKPTWIRHELMPPRLLAEGRYTERWQVEAALHAGATAVVVGGAVNDPLKNTARLMPRKPYPGKVAVVDIGGTWLRMAQWTYRGPDEQALQKLPLPPGREQRLALISEFLKSGQFDRVGISSAGVIWNNRVILSKKFIPENQGTDYNVLREYLTGNDPLGVIALGDGHASAWAHACHPDFAGLDVVVLAIGTGLGFGHVRQGKIVMGPQGEYSRLNDVPGPGSKTFEQILGGMFLTAEPTHEQKALANEAVHNAIRMVSTFTFPDVVVVCGTVGMQAWLNLDIPPVEGWPQVPVVRSPFGADAGLQGAAALALYPPL
jgi:putative N-acetylmannosamine-6-phosphate epimerase